MKTCPKCNELNGNNRTDCWKCQADLGGEKESIRKYKKICTKCGYIYSQKKETCDECGKILSVYSKEHDDTGSYGDSGNDGGKKFGLAVGIPIIVMILGLIFISIIKDETTFNGGVILGGVIAVLAGAFSFWQPEIAWNIEYGLRYKNAEPSDLAIGMIQFSGVVLYIGGIIAIIVGLLS
jgi:hypothetical protein